MVTYRLGQNEKTLERDFPQLSYRIRQLEDRMISYLLRGELSCVVSYSFERESVAQFAEVTFDEKLAQKYEAFMERYFRKTKNKVSSQLPRPSFAVELVVRFPGGEEEKFAFPFAAYSDETLLTFCRAVEERKLYYYRHRFSKNK